MFFPSKFLLFLLFPFPDPLPDHHLVLLLDAYDVLLLPRIALIDMVVSESRAPVLFCAESGVYPETGSEW